MCVFVVGQLFPGLGNRYGVYSIYMPELTVAVLFRNHFLSLFITIFSTLALLYLCVCARGCEWGGVCV